MPKRIFLTGAAGFIGFHLAQRLRKRGDEILGLDNFNDYYDPKLKELRATILRNEDVQVVKEDICNSDAVRTLVENFRPTHFVHLAAQAGVRYSISHPKSYIRTNLDGFYHLLEIARLHPKIPFIYASSASVYGTNQKIPFSETDPTDTPANLYGATKKANESMAYAYHNLFGIPMTGLRFFTVYGPYGRPDMAYYSFTKAICQGDPINVFNEGHMERDFTYIDDIVDGTLAAIDLSAPWEIFNLGHNEPQKVLKMIDILENCLNKKAVLHLQPMPLGEISTTYADITHSSQKLGFSPKVPLEEGLRSFVQWYLQEHVDK